VIQNDIQNKMSQAMVTEGVELAEVTATAPEEQNPLFKNSCDEERTAEQVAADKLKVLAAIAKENEWAAKIGIFFCLITTGISLIMAAVFVSRALNHEP
jgi:hypothetical protein